jgi:hypothetical protein
VKWMIEVIDWMTRDMYSIYLITAGTLLLLRNR